MLQHKVTIIVVMVLYGYTNLYKIYRVILFSCYLDYSVNISYWHFFFILLHLFLNERQACCWRVGSGVSITLQLFRVRAFCQIQMLQQNCQRTCVIPAKPNTTYKLSEQNFHVFCWSQEFNIFGNFNDYFPCTSFFLVFVFLQKGATQNTWQN